MTNDLDRKKHHNSWQLIGSRCSRVTENRQPTVCLVCDKVKMFCNNPGRVVYARHAYPQRGFDNDGHKP